MFLFSFALLWRALYLHQVAAGSPFFDAPTVDAQAFFQQAEQFAATFSLGEEPFTGPPLYPAFLGVLYWLFGADFFAFRLIQFTLGALSVVLLYLIGRRVFSPGVGLAAGAAASVYGPLVYFEGELLPPGLAILLNLSLVLFLLRAGTVSRPWSCLAAGLLLGVAGLAVPHVFLFGPGVAGWMLLRRDSGLPARLGRVLLLALGVFLVIGGTTWRNYHKGGDLVLLSSDSGLSFFLGNNPDRERTAGLGPGADRDELIRHNRSGRDWKNPRSSRSFSGGRRSPSPGRSRQPSCGRWPRKPSTSGREARFGVTPTSTLPAPIPGCWPGWCGIMGSPSRSASWAPWPWPACCWPSSKDGRG